MQFPRMIRFTALVAALALPACDDGGDPTPPDTGGDVVGDWVLVSVAGQQLPLSQTVIDPEFGSCIYTLTSMDWDFMDGGRFETSTITSLKCGTEPATTDTTTFTGEYRTEGNQLITTDDDDPDGQEYTVFYTVEGNTFSMRDGGIRYIFTRDLDG